MVNVWDPSSGLSWVMVNNKKLLCLLLIVNLMANGEDFCHKYDVK